MPSHAHLSCCAGVYALLRPGRPLSHMPVVTMNIQAIGTASSCDRLVACARQCQLPLASVHRTLNSQYGRSIVSRCAVSAGGHDSDSYDTRHNASNAVHQLQCIQAVEEPAGRRISLGLQQQLPKALIITAAAVTIGLVAPHAAQAASSAMAEASSSWIQSKSTAAALCQHSGICSSCNVLCTR